MNAITVILWKHHVNLLLQSFRHMLESSWMSWTDTKQALFPIQIYKELIIQD